MNIAVLNAGSGSQKLSLFNLGNTLPNEPGDPTWSAKINTTTPNQPEGKLWVEVASLQGNRREVVDQDASFTTKVELLLAMLQQAMDGGVPDVIGHRVVHGGGRYTTAVPISAAVEEDIEQFAAFAPLHNHDNLTGIHVARRKLGEGVCEYAVFDTAFHHTLPEAAYTYPGPHDWVKRGIRRHGFHGTSFRWASERAAQLLKLEGDPSLRLILCHLGGGCSLAATVGGRCIDTTMGFTPLDGIAMCSRSGALDPGILFYLLRRGMSVDDLEKLLNKDSGLKGLSGLVGDTRVILPKAKSGDRRARLALDVFVHRLTGGIGQMMAALGERPDAVVFTDAIGEDEPCIRAAACMPFQHIGLELDSARNTTRAFPQDTDVATAASRVRVLVIQSREDWQIARECFVDTQKSGG